MEGQYGRIIESLWLVDREMDETEHGWKGVVKLCFVADHGLCLRGSAFGDLYDGFLKLANEKRSRDVKSARPFCCMANGFL